MKQADLKKLILQAIRERSILMNRLAPKTHISSSKFRWMAYAEWSRKEGEWMALRAVLDAIRGYPLSLIEMGRRNGKIK